MAETIGNNKQEKRKTFRLRSKLILAFFGVALLAVVVVGAVSVNNIYRFSKREVERNSIANLKSAMDNTQDFLLGLRADVVRLESRYSSINEINAGLAELLETGQTSYENQFQLELQLNTIRAKVGVNSVFIMNEERVLSYVKDSEMSFDYMMRNTWFSNWYWGNEKYAWGPAYAFQGTQVIPYVRKIFYEGELIGVSVLNITESTVRSYWSDYGNIVLLGRGDCVLSARDSKSLGMSFEESYEVDLTDVSSGSSFTVRHNGTAYHGVLYREPIYGMAMVELLPQSTTQTVVVDMLTSTLGILLVVMVVCAVLAVVLSSQITKPLQNVTELVDSLKLGTPAVEMPVTSNDEIGMLMESINNMTRRLEASREEILEISDARRLAEYRAIQLQINPHFLYNTLSSINWFAEQNQPENVKKVADSLSMLFRISVNHGREMLHIIEEIQHVRCYLDIQKLRHRDEFTYQIDVDPEILSFYTIKIILQPLVENSLYHGIRENGISSGFIRVVGRRKGETVELLVIDNGNTSQAEIDRMNAVLQNPKSREDEGVGMLNVHNRIRYFYQNGYGLKYEKKDDLTIARVELPVVEEAREDV